MRMKKGGMMNCDKRKECDKELHCQMCGRFLCHPKKEAQLQCLSFCETEGHYCLPDNKCLCISCKNKGND